MCGLYIRYLIFLLANISYIKIKNKVIEWRKAYLQTGLAGLEDKAKKERSKRKPIKKIV